MPKLGVEAQPALATVEHPLLINELLGDPTDAANNALAGAAPYRIQFPEKLQWMVFKVKQRAKKDYFAQIGRAPSENIPFYTFNWPYDQFSLVELAQVQADVTFERTFGEEITGPPNDEITPQTPGAAAEFGLETSRVNEDTVEASLEFTEDQFNTTPPTGGPAGDNDDINLAGAPSLPGSFDSIDASRLSLGSSTGVSLDTDTNNLGAPSVGTPE